MTIPMTTEGYVQRRQALMDVVGKGGMAILPAAPIVYRSKDVEYPYRQDSYLWYLTGFPEPEALMVLVPGREQGQFILFCRENDPEKELWNGHRAGLEGACQLYGADDAFPITDIDDIVPGLMESCKRVYHAMGLYPEFDQKLLDWINQLRAKARTGVHPPNEVVNLDSILNEMRLIKSTQEQAYIRQAARISVQAHCRAMRFAVPGRYEYQVAAEIYHEFQINGAQAPAYSAIVGGGANACILHYIANQDPLRDGELLLIDAGAEYNGYAADITRTFPCNGRFSPAQATLYNLVLKAQQAALAEIRPGNTWIMPHNAAVETITRGLCELGLLFGKVDELIDEEAYKKYFMHRTGHWLGMDVHDVGDYKIEEDWRELEPGMVMTVEPGLYIPAQKEVDEQWWNIGIRIEDNVLVTQEGYELLTTGLPRTVAEIEAFIAQARSAPAL